MLKMLSIGWLVMSFITGINIVSLMVDGLMFKELPADGMLEVRMT